MVLIGGQFLPCCIKSGMLTLVGFPPRYRGVRPRPVRRKGRSNPHFLKVGDPAQFNMSADDNALGWMAVAYLLVKCMFIPCRLRVWSANVTVRCLTGHELVDLTLQCVDGSGDLIPELLCRRSARCQHPILRHFTWPTVLTVGLLPWARSGSVSTSRRPAEVRWTVVRRQWRSVAAGTSSRSI